MPKNTTFTAGWIDTTIHDFFAEIEAPPSTMAYTLLTCLDSSFDLRTVMEKSQALQSLKGSCKIIGHGALVPTRQLLKAERRNRIFFGFDEVWFFPRPPVRPKPQELVITGPNRITADLLAHVSKWMQKTGCSLGLGDGTGMNFCARIGGMAGYLLRASSESDLRVCRNGRVSA
jgi:hypothetical protein